METIHPGPAERYHTATGYARDRMQGHALDWANQPWPYKDYSGAQTVSLPTDIEFPAVSLWDLPADDCDRGVEGAVDLRRLATVCALTHRFTARRRLQGQTFLYRSVASAGALYPAELYLVAHDTEGLKSGVYYYDIRDFTLKALRSGHDPVGGAARRQSRKAYSAVASFVITGVFFRSAWKYRARALRYVLLDAGHMLENLRNALFALNISHRIDYDFDDEALNRLLGLDQDREAALVNIALSPGPALPADAACPMPLDPTLFDSALSPADPVAARETGYDAIARLHRVSQSLPPRPLPPKPDIQVTDTRPTTWHALPPFDPTVPVLDYAEAVMQRRSKRNFVDRPVPARQAHHLMDLLCAAMGKNCHAAAVLQVGFLAGAVEGRSAGFYLLDGPQRKVGCIRTGRLTASMASVCLDQQWLKNAGLHFVFMVNLRTLDRVWGARGYRYAMLEAGRLGQCLYLGAAALGLGCCGIGALYDNEARSVLTLNNESVLLYLVAAGVVRG